jgi:hypothetical protein
LLVVLYYSFQQYGLLNTSKDQKMSPIRFTPIAEATRAHKIALEQWLIASHTMKEGDWHRAIVCTRHVCGKPLFGRFFSRRFAGKMVRFHSRYTHF